MPILDHRYEILFLYETKDCNPNGDPLDENRPRTDPETGEATVTDVRIKRTVRDFLLTRQPDVSLRLKEGMEILIRDTFKPNGYLAQGKDRAEWFIEDAIADRKGAEKLEALREAIMKRCIDARLFGCAIPLGQKEASLRVTGPVQFMPFNRSLHRVYPQMVQQIAAFAGSAAGTQKSFAERWILPYALIGVYGLANENAARITGMTGRDLDRLLEALWYGTASLNTHSKMGHDPMLLMVIENQPGHKIGALQQRIAMVDRVAEETAIRSACQFAVDFAVLLDAVAENEKVTSVWVRHNTRLRCKDGAREAALGALMKKRGIPFKELEFDQDENPGI